MRSIIIIILLLVVGTYMTAQTINDVPLSEIDVEFIQIVGTKKILSTRVNIDIEFGQLNKLFSAHDTRVKDDEGKQITFNSMIDALNFMSENGYEYVDSYALTIGNTNVYHFLMKKRK